MFASRYDYTIGSDDVITHVSDAWVRFAEENEAPELSAPNVVGRPIWDFVQGSTVRRLYGDVFRQLREERREVLIPFRCDSPNRERHMDLLLQCPDGGEILASGQLLFESLRDPVQLFARRSPRSPDTLPICSLCRRFLVLGEWMTAADALRRTRLLNHEPLPVLDETVCGRCRAALQRKGIVA